MKYMYNFLEESSCGKSEAICENILSSLRSSLDSPFITTEEKENYQTYLNDAEKMLKAMKESRGEENSRK